MRAPTHRRSGSKQVPQNRLGVFVRSPAAGEAEIEEYTRDLHSAFVADLAARLATAGYRPTMFVASEQTATVSSLFDSKWSVVAQADGLLGHRLAIAFEHLLRTAGDRAVIIGTDSPDLPLAYIKRAFQRLKHCDVVLGPSIDGGYYLVGLRTPAPALFANIAWGTSQVLAQTLDAIEREGLSLALSSPWYGLTDEDSLQFFTTLQRARALAGAKPLPHCARVLAARVKD